MSEIYKKPLPRAKREKTVNSKTAYVDNEKLSEALKAWKLARSEAAEAGQPEPKMPNLVGEAIYKVAHELSSKGNFAGYTYRDEMVSDGILQCCKYIKNFDPFRGSSAFAYITQVCYNTFIGRISTEKRHQYISAKLLVEMPVTDDMAEVEADDTSLDNRQYHMENVDDFIKHFEAKNGIGQSAKKRNKNAIDKLFDD